ncbi:DUF3572 domain-containing protein [Ancylobacter terrae]|uniref:DUF3572 domain-containing protein n=1 Tax=Ancylobacter sp. sgz301288 TaxID=3342077 RepID=UPI00385B697A
MRTRKPGTDNGFGAGRPRAAARLTNRRAATEVATGALTFLAAAPERIGPLLAESGLAPADLRRVIGSAAFHVAILDHLLNHQDLLLEYAANAGIDPGHVVAAREILAHEGDADSGG